jgi:type VI secretion system protein ImpE
MIATELYKAGRLNEAIEAQIKEVKGNPADQSKRLFLYELLGFSGELERARRQIEALNYDDPDLVMTLQSYRKLIESEEARRKLFTEGLAPGFFGEPSEHLRLRLEAVNRLREGHFQEAAETLARADEATPPIAGTLNGVAFASFRDADDLLGGVLEVMAQGRYFWVGLEQVVTVAMNPPKFPRDLLYVPARIELLEEAGDVFLPALYPGTYKHADDQVRLGRMTDWSAHENGPTLGLGLHVYLRDDEPVTLLEWREFHAPAATPEAADEATPAAADEPSPEA